MTPDATSPPDIRRPVDERFEPTSKGKRDATQTLKPVPVVIDRLGGGSFDGGSVDGTETTFDPGVTGSGAVGLDLSRVSRLESGPWRHVRLDLEAFFSRNTVDEVSGKGLSFPDVEAFAAGGLLNVYYDLDLSRLSGGTMTKVKPYIGAGVGGAAINLDDTALRDDQDEVLAYQARAGLGYAFTPSMTGTIGYRFFDTNDPEFTAPDGSTFHSEYRSHSVELGLRYTF